MLRTFAALLRYFRHVSILYNTFQRRNYTNINITMKKILLSVCLMASTMLFAANPSDVLRAYNRAGGGYVIINADNEVVGFSSEGQIEANDASDLFFLGKQIQIIDAPEQAEQVFGFPAPVKDSVGPLLGDIAYNQGKPYHNMTPTIGNTHCLTGCVATAMAQIARYWQWPKTCNEGVVTYTPAKVGEPVTYTYTGHSFDWDNMKTQYTGIIADGGEYPETVAQQNAVADLMLACGVGVYMNYGTDGSGSTSTNVPKVFRQYFNYMNDLELHRVEDLNTQGTLMTGLIAEFDAGRPVYCDGYNNIDNQGDAFHAYVIDGYVTLQGDDNLTAPYFHFNFGWGGSKNGWYRITGNRDRSDYSSLNVIFKLRPNAPTGLMDAVESLKDGKIRDIMGREVSETVSGQLYIQDGRKFIAR